MLLAEIEIGENLYRVSMTGVAMTRYWHPYIIAFDTPRYQAPTPHGGFCRLGFGGVTISTLFFSELAGAWPPPRTIVFRAFRYLQGSELGVVPLFEGIGHRDGISADGTEATYELYRQDVDVDLLDTAIGYTGDTVTLPRIAGPVAFARGVRLENRDNPVGWPNLTNVTTFHSAYVSGVLGVDWFVHENGFDITSIARDNGDNTFSLNSSPVGEVTVSGVGRDTQDLTAFAEWMADRINDVMGYEWTVDIQYAALPSPPLACYLTDQDNILEAFSAFCDWHCHLALRKDNEVVLSDMAGNREALRLTEFEMFMPTYADEPPQRRFVGVYTEFEAINDTGGRRIADREIRVPVKTPYTYASVDLEIAARQRDRASVEKALAQISDVYHRDGATVSVPVNLMESPPIPGEKVCYTTEVSLPVATDYWMIVESVGYDFAGYRYILEGKGAMSQAVTEASKAGIVSPVHGTQLSGDSEIFQWRDTGNGYRLWVGTESGSSDIHNSGDLGNGVVSDTVTGLPSNGSTVYARLWTLIGDSWEYNDYSYTASDYPDWRSMVDL